MQGTGRNLLAIAVALAALAGFVDAIAFSALGFFASLMSANSTRLGVALSVGEAFNVATAAALLLAFVAGVIVASVVARVFAVRQRIAILGLVTVLLGAAAALSDTLGDRVDLLLVASAMGAASIVFASDGAGTIGATSGTGALVRFGQELTAALIGEGGRWDWLPHLVLWVGFATGAIMGAGAYLRLGMSTLWIATAAAAVLTGTVALVAPKAQ